MGEKVTQAEFARRMGVAPKNIDKAAKNGRIRKDPDGKIDFETASEDWVKNRDPAQDRSGISSHDDGGYGRARTLQTAWNVKIKQLQYEKASGKLIEKDLVVSSIRKFTIYVRDSILLIPDRVSSRLSSEIEEYVAKVLRKHLPKSQCDKILLEISSDHVHKITREAWDEESRSVMEELENGRVIKEEANNKRNNKH